MYQTLVAFLLLIIIFIVSTTAPQPGNTDNAIHNCSFNGSIPIDQEELDPNCLEYFNTHVASKRSVNEITTSQYNYIRSLVREGVKSLDALQRGKRQANPKRVRRECRSMRDSDREDLFFAMRHLKFNTTDNVYDMFAGFHSSETADGTIHRGSNFLGWHRVYLFFFEQALLRIKPVPLCYWDSTLDYLITGTGQNNTVMFTNELVGNGEGMVINGPFRYWPVPSMRGSLRRSIANGASLMRPEIADRIMYDRNINRHIQIMDLQPVSLEGEHNNVHVWVGEVMDDILNAPQDGVFWLHHTYIDYLWEKFRQKMRRLGLEPENDYPGTRSGGDSHGPDKPMYIFYSRYHNFWTNKNGYSDILTYSYEYADHPTCGNNCGGNTRFLYCPSSSSNTNDRCVSRTADTDTVSRRAVGKFGGRTTEFDFTKDTATGSIKATSSLARNAATQEGDLNRSSLKFSTTFTDPRLT